MSWDDLGIPDMNDIPDRYLCSWKFFNAFFEAFQERADYIENVPRAVTYDDLILTAGQIGAVEFRTRLGTFKNNVRGCINNTTWYKESTWTELSNFTHEATTANKTFPTLDVITLDEWDETALRALLTDDVYDLIFENDNFDVNFRPSYWSGIYKLINEVMLYRDLSVSNVYTPEPTEPILYLNGEETFTGFDENLSVILAESISDSTIFQGGNNKIMARGLVGFESTYRKFSNGNEDATQRGRVNYIGLTIDPFCKAPALMDIQLLTWRALGSGGVESEFSGTGDENTATPTNGTRVEQRNEPVSSSKTTSVVDGEEQDPVYVPSQELYLLTYAQNPQFPSSYDEEAGFINISLASIPDIRVSNSVSSALAVTGEPDGPAHPYTSSKFSAETTGEYYLNMALCALPQSEFEFPAE